MGGDRKDDEVEDGSEEEDEFSTVVAGEDIGTVVGRDDGVHGAAAAWPSLWSSVQSS